MEYKEYKQIVDIIEGGSEIKNLIEREIKKLQKEATYLEYHEDNRIKIDSIIEEKTKELIIILSIKNIYLN